MTVNQQTPETSPGERILTALAGRNIVLVGMMGAGKTSIGKRLAAALAIPFTDADHEIEIAANMTIPEIFETYGEDHFRDGERKVIARLLCDGPKVIATGGGAVSNSETRERIGRKAVSIWLKADIPVLLERVRRRSNRPLLRAPDPEGVLRKLLTEREQHYAGSDLTIVSHNAPHQVVLEEILDRLNLHLRVGARQQQSAEPGT